MCLNFPLFHKFLAPLLFVSKLQSIVSQELMIKNPSLQQTSYIDFMLTLQWATVVPLSEHFQCLSYY